MIAKNAAQMMVLLGGDLNDTPDSQTLQALWSDGFEDVQNHDDYPTDRPGTYATGTAGNKIDYVIMSVELSRRPNASIANPTAASTGLCRLTSQATAKACKPDARNATASASMRSAVRAVRTTAMPACANRLAMAVPISRPAPVTTTVHRP